MTETFHSLGEPKKEEKIMHRFLRLGAGFLLALGLVANASAQTEANGTTAATALPFPTTMTALATIVGSSGGAFTYYTFNNPTPVSGAKLSVTVYPPDPV